MNKRAMIGAAVILGALFFLKSRNANASEAPTIAAGEQNPASGGWFGGLGAATGSGGGGGGFWQGYPTDAGSLGDSSADDSQLPVTPTTQDDAGQKATDPDIGPQAPAPTGNQDWRKDPYRSPPIIPQAPTGADSSAGPGAHHFIPTRKLEPVPTIQPVHKQPMATKTAPKPKPKARTKPHIIKKTPGNGTPIIPQAPERAFEKKLARHPGLSRRLTISRG